SQPGVVRFRVLLGPGCHRLSTESRLGSTSLSLISLSLSLCSDSFSKMLLQKEELEQKHLHLVQIVESEKTAKWQYTQQCEELTMEIKKLRAEVSGPMRSKGVTEPTHSLSLFLFKLCALKREWRLTPNQKKDNNLFLDEDSEEIRKI